MVDSAVATAAVRPSSSRLSFRSTVQLVPAPERDASTNAAALAGIRVFLAQCAAVLLRATTGRPLRTR